MSSTIKSFKDLATNSHFDGTKITINEILDKEIIVTNLPY